ncbi:hypothetical protein L3X38_013152 [Prunus dulcis]|uniref:Uncharacterized protein n=1 Tax=Prunus dulcis TaxID=3755 RepID=A0AAD4WKP4_PRUDU|nr:hypothetical protein L3X38_013152 [Prunus dulcis]
MHSASAMADTNMEKKDFARRLETIRRAKRRRENLLFRRTKQHFRRAITCRQLLFCATKKFIRRTEIPSREYKRASRKVHASSRQLIYFVAQVLTDVDDVAVQEIRDCGVEDDRLMTLNCKSMTMKERLLLRTVLHGSFPNSSFQEFSPSPPPN